MAKSEWPNYLWTLPHELPKNGKVIVHNRVHAQWADQVPGDNGFRAWTCTQQALSQSSAEPCNCGWSGLPHYRIDAKKGEPWHYGKPRNVKGKRMPPYERARRA